MFDTKTNEQLFALVPTLPIIIGEASLRHDIDDLVSQTLPVKCFAIIDDVNTNLVFGNKVFNALKERFNCIHITLLDGVEADGETINYIRKKTSICDALIAVGSGTINDLCKYSSHLDNKPYLVFPTAASMNGYLSVNASISINGHKTTITAQLPKAVFCDFSVITNAPVRLSKSGIGDSLARPTAQADWLVSHLLLGSFYDERPFKLLADIEPELFDNAAGIAKNDPKTIKALMKLLLLSGIGMTISGGSYPASQSEHMIAHSYNMLKKPAKKHKALHGEEIVITSFYMAKRQEYLLKTTPKLCSEIFDKAYLSELFGSSLTAEFQTEFTKKQALINQSSMNINQAKWDDISDKIVKIMMPSSQMENIIKKAELLATLEDLGWNKKDFTTACDVARFTRDRFTFLDME